MKQSTLQPWIFCVVIFVVSLISTRSASTNFVNFETAPVHPVAISPDGSIVALCNLPDGRVELYDLQMNPPRHLGSIPVGIDPVTVRFRSSTELWVVNHISDSINIVHVPSRQVIEVIDTPDGPADVVFARNGDLAFVSCPPVNRVVALDLAAKSSIPITIEGERPKAMALSPDGSKIYVAIMESGNGTTILTPRLTSLTHFASAGPVDLPISPHGGMNPPPNSGTNFSPRLNRELGTNQPPRVSLIVKRQRNGRWLDDNNGDWTQFVSGTNAAFSGRVPGWDLLDHDVAVIDTATLKVGYVDRLMNICFDLAVNPKSGAVALIGSEGLNHIRYEPILQSIFTRVHLALIEPDLSSARVMDLNAHLSYQVRKVPAIERAKSIGDPRGAVWDADGKRLFVTGMGSDNLIVLDDKGARIGAPIPLPSGPTGLAFDAKRNRLYILNRFASSLTVLDASQLTVLHTVPIYDPTPQAIRAGRVHFYNTHKNSGLGQASCASCHVDGRMDRLAWDLGTPAGKMKEITSQHHNFGAISPARTNHFHPMKGPMVTQTFQDIIGKEPFHWRGDRNGIEEFNPTFVDLQSRDNELAQAEMQEFEDFLATITFPPNRFRNFDNTLPVSLPLPGHTALGRGQRLKGAPLPNGNAQQGLQQFKTAALQCSECHTLQTGLGPDQVFRNERWSGFPLGPNGEHHIALAALERSMELPFKVVQLRNLPDKVGLDYSKPSLSGFGFMHDGGVDTLARFLQDGFSIQNDQETANLIAFLLAFSGSDLQTNFSVVNSLTPPGTQSRDVSAAAGKQVMAKGVDAPVQNVMQRANAPGSRLELVAKGLVNGQTRGWLWLRGANSFQSDQETEWPTLSELLNLASPQNPLLFTLVPLGTGRRLAIDRDDDGYLDQDELQKGSDPANPVSVPGSRSLASTHVRIRESALQIKDGALHLTWNSLAGQRYRILYSPALSEQVWSVMKDDILAAGTQTSCVLQSLGSKAQGFFKIELISEP